MKLKGIKPIEQHVEKIVAAFAAVAGVGLLGYQFIKPNDVKVGTRHESPAHAFDPVKTAAAQLNDRLSEQNPALPPAPAAALGDQLTLGAATPISTAKVLTALGPTPVVGKASGGGPVAAATFQLPSVPAPTGISRSSFRSTISPVEVIRNPELAKSGLLPAQQPFDKASVSVEAAFNGQSLKEQMLSDPDGSGPMEAIPLGWWRDPVNEAADLLSIVAVEMERKTLREPDGSTPEKEVITTVPVLPGRTDTLAMWNANVKSIGDVPPYVEQLRAMSEQILRPAYFSTIAGPEWKPPAEAVAAADPDKSHAADVKKRELRDVDERITEIKAKIEAGPAGAAPPPGRERTAPPPPPSRGGGGGKGGSGGGGNVPGPPPKIEPVFNKKALENSLKSLNEKRQRIVKQLEELGEKVEAAPADATKAAAGPVPLLDNPEVRLFAHDFTVQPGAQYAYRVRVIINNPLYGRNLKDTQKKLGESKLIQGAWSEWSAPVDVDPDRAFFITSAEQGSDLVPTPRANVEMFEFKYGYYRSATASLSPGDSMVATAKMPELKTADLKKLEELLKDPNGIPAPEAAPPMPPPRAPGGGKGSGGGRTPPPIDERRPAAPPPTPGTIEMPAEWLSVPLDKESKLSVDAVFLDANTLPVDATGLAGEVRQRIQAIFRDGFGHIMIRQPDMDRGSETYKRLAASAKSGETQGQLRIKPEDTKPEIGPKPPPLRNRPAGGGGGGGGGG